MSTCVHVSVKKVGVISLCGCFSEEGECDQPVWVFQVSVISLCGCFSEEGECNQPVWVFQ